MFCASKQLFYFARDSVGHEVRGHGRNGPSVNVWASAGEISGWGDWGPGTVTGGSPPGAPGLVLPDAWFTPAQRSREAAAGSGPRRSVQQQGPPRAHRTGADASLLGTLLVTRPQACQIDGDALIGESKFRGDKWAGGFTAAVFDTVGHTRGRSRQPICCPACEGGPAGGGVGVRGGRSWTPLRGLTMASFLLLPEDPTLRPRACFRASDLYVTSLTYFTFQSLSVSLSTAVALILSTSCLTHVSARDAWVTQQLPSAQGTILESSIESCIRLPAWSLLLPLPVSLPLSLSLSLINKILKK
ncbi:hypothetical protein VULLAG_LOCUS18612 [Vulpes lagopus]